MVFRMSELKIKKPNEILHFLKAPKKNDEPNKAHNVLEIYVDYWLGYAARCGLEYPSSAIVSNLINSVYITCQKFQLLSLFECSVLSFEQAL